MEFEACDLFVFFFARLFDFVDSGIVRFVFGRCEDLDLLFRGHRVVCDRLRFRGLVSVVVSAFHDHVVVGGRHGGCGCKCIAR